MENTGVSGKVAYTGKAKGIPDLIIQAVDLTAIPDEETFGWSKTDTSGSYSIPVQEVHMVH